MALPSKETFVIDKGIPMPLRGYQLHGPIWDVINDMDIGDSFLVQSGNRAYYEYAKRQGRQISIRKTNKGWRIWRVK